MLYLGLRRLHDPVRVRGRARSITGRFGEGWLADVRRTTLIAWGFLTVGIVLGAWWSYEVLGWGGYWGWDPVENASLLPWLTATAFIHSVMVQERRGMLRVWNLSLVLATFCLTILGHVPHPFGRRQLGARVLAVADRAVAAHVPRCRRASAASALIAWRGDKLRSPGRIDSPVSREAAFLVNNLLFAGFALVVLTGTVFPLLVEALQDRQLVGGRAVLRTARRPDRDRAAVPHGGRARCCRGGPRAASCSASGC